MADPKYANLPGIDTSEKDTYESGELTEVDQHWVPEELSSESVEKEEVNAREAQKKFNAKYISIDETDFSGKIGSRAGYESGDFVIAGKDEIETPTQKLQRLKAELAQLYQNLQPDSSEKSTPPTDLLQEIHTLQSQLTSHEMSSTSAGGTFGKLLSYLDEVTSSEKTAKQAAKSQDPLGTYTLMIQPGQAQQKFSEKLSMIEQRMAKLERAVGVDSDRLAVLTAQTKQKNLRASVDALVVKRSVLDPDLLPQVDTRLQAVLNKLNDINKAQKQKGVEEVATNKKIIELYELVEKWDSVCGSLPEIVQRLETLNELHQQAAEFSSSLNHMESVQSQIVSKLSDTTALVKQADSVFKQNASTIQGNIQALEKRIQSLSTK